jgi:hypothetical protein
MSQAVGRGGRRVRLVAYRPVSTVTEEPERSESAELQRWWEIYAERLERELESQSQKRLESESFLYALLIVAPLALVALDATEWDYAWWEAILLGIAVAWLVALPLVIATAILQWPIKTFLRGRRDAEFVRLVELSRVWAYSAVGYGPPSAVEEGGEARPPE